VALEKLLQQAEFVTQTGWILPKISGKQSYLDENGRSALGKRRGPC
jgi:hypothetical protein